MADYTKYTKQEMQAYAIAKKTTDKIMKELGKRYPDVFETDGNEKVPEEEPLVERDFEG